MNNSFSDLEHSQDVNMRVEQIFSHVKDAETGARGYFITNNPYFLNPYYDVINKIDTEFIEIKRVLSNDSSYSNALDSLQFYLRSQIRLLRQSVNFFKRENRITPEVVETTYNSKRMMDRTREIVNAIQQKEMERLEERKANRSESFETAIYVIIISSAVSVLLFTGIMIILKNEFDKKTIIEKELKIYQYELEQQVLMLNHNNMELEQFAYVASHDLQEPLRKIISFSERIQKKLGAGTDNEINQYLERLSNSAARMRTLIQDLLNYSRTTKLPDISEPVNLTALFKDILDDLDETITRKNAMIYMEPLITVRGNATQLRQLFQNILSNALKFSKVDQQPEIIITGQVLKNTDELIKKNVKSILYERYFCTVIQDNGIGFDEQYAEKIFVIFQRLHGKSAYEGTGIGLAICKRIVENHFGFITVKSELGRGASFIIGLPLKQEQT